MNNIEARKMMEQIKNSTVAKLTTNECLVLGLANIGFGFYRGTLKTRFNGMKRVTDDGITFSFDGKHRRIDFIKIVEDTEDTKELHESHYAARIYNKDNECWETFPMGIIGVDFFR